MKNKNTYSMLLRDEEKGRSIFEHCIYALIVICTAFSGWQFASNSVALPGMPVAGQNNPATTIVAKATPPAPPTDDRG